MTRSMSRLAKSLSSSGGSPDMQQTFTTADGELAQAEEAWNRANGARQRFVAQDCNNLWIDLWTTFRTDFRRRQISNTDERLPRMTATVCRRRIPHGSPDSALPARGFDGSRRRADSSRLLPHRSQGFPPCSEATPPPAATSPSISTPTPTIVVWNARA